MRDLDRRIPVYWLLHHGSLTSFGCRSKVWAWFIQIVFSLLFSFRKMDTGHISLAYIACRRHINHKLLFGLVAKSGTQLHQRFTFICVGAASFTHQLLTFSTRLPHSSAERSLATRGTISLLLSCPHPHPSLYATCAHHHSTCHVAAVNGCRSK